MTEIRKDANGQLVALCQDTPGDVARQRLLTTWSEQPVTVYPLAAASLALAERDLLLCGEVGRAWEATVAALNPSEEIRVSDVPGSYTIGLATVGERRVLYALGADRAGLLYALETLTQWSEFVPDGLIYRRSAEEAVPALPYRLLWTWDHSTNWALGYPSQTDWGVNNAYLKPPEAFLDDYMRLIDYASRNRLNGVIIWGIFRDAHGGIVAAQQLCTYARQHGVRLLAGLGTSFYGGFYYQGCHPFSAEVWLRKHPDYAARDRHGRQTERLCPSEPANQAWLREGVHWLFETFDLGGINLESGDFMVCHCERCRAQRALIAGDDPEFLQEMVLSLAPVIEEILRIRSDAWITYGTYTGFCPGPLPRELGDPDPNVVANMANMGSANPVVVRALPPKAIVQWSLTAMVREKPVPLLALLDDGIPDELLVAPNWPGNLRPPARHNMGLLHQGSQWFSRERGDTRYQVEIASIKEACLRGYRAGLEGLAITGEASPQYTACELNYLALAHFSYHPEDSLHAFARATLAPLVGGVDAADAFVTYLAKRDAGCMAAADETALQERVRAESKQAAGGGDWDRFRRWRWLGAYGTGLVVDGTGSLLTP